MDNYRAYTGRQAIPKNTDDCRFFLLNEINVIPATEQLFWDQESLPDEAVPVFPVGEFGGKPVILCLTDDGFSGKTVAAREYLATASDAEATLYSHATQLLRSEKDHAFCGRCGTRNSPVENEWAMSCRSCEVSYYPRISPCIIVLVKKDDELLLVQHHKHLRHNPVYTTVAGFMEPGESAEQAVFREVLEETGIRVGNIRYHFSQSWPFPHSLMLGFHAEYESGELTLEEKELSDGSWFKKDDLPEIPPGFTIARRLIDLALDT